LNKGQLVNVSRSNTQVTGIASVFSMFHTFSTGMNAVNIPQEMHCHQQLTANTLILLIGYKPEFSPRLSVILVQ